MKKSEISTLKKVAKQKSIEILEKRALVNNGRIFASNIDLCVSFVTDIKGSGVIEIEAIEKNYDSAEIRDGFLYVTRGTSVSKSAVLKTEDYPEIFEKGKNIGIFNDLNAVNQIAHFSGNDPIRPALSGIHFDETNITCTDAHRLGWRTKTGTTISELTLKASDMILLTSEFYQVYEAKDNPSYVIFESENETFYFRLITVPYPKYQAVIPQNNPLEITVNTKELIEALKSSEFAACKIKKQAVFTIFENKLTVSSKDSERKTDFSIELPISMNLDIELFKIAFNIKFMIDVISKENPETLISFAASNRAMLVNMNNLIMPVMIETAPNEFDYYQVTPKQTLTPEPIAETATEPINQSTNQPINEEEKPAEITQSVAVREIMIIDYSEKAIAVYGDTAEFTETFEKMYGIYRSWLKIQDVKIGGWIFSKKRRAQIEKLINA